MENLYIESTQYSPEIDFDAKSGTLNITGSCYLEYTLDFFKPIFDWLEKHMTQGQKKIILNFNIEHFNTSSSRRFQEMIDMLVEYEEKNKGQVIVNWYYDKNHPESRESGEDFARGLKIKFNLIAV